MTRYRFLLTFVSLVLMGFSPTSVASTLAAETSPIAADSNADADPSRGSISEVMVAESASTPSEVAPVPSNAGGGTVPKNGPSPAAANTPDAQASPGSVTSNVPIAKGSAFTEIFHPDQWQWPHNFTLKDPDTWPFIPVPEIATDPNGGTTVGILAAVLYTDAKNQITNIFAPDLETNTTLGPNFLNISMTVSSGR